MNGPRLVPRDPLRKYHDPLHGAGLGFDEAQARSGKLGRREHRQPDATITAYGHLREAGRAGG